MEMEYKNEWRVEVLANGQYKGYNYWILSLGTHPTAYVEVPRGHPYWFKNYNDIPVCVHGGLSYSRNYLSDLNSGEWTIGWDYMHFGDYVGYMSEIEKEFYGELKKWSRREIFDEVRSVINQLRELE